MDGKSRTILIMKDTSQGNVARNCRPITCLHLMWKLLTGIISEEMYMFLDESRILPVEQKGSRKQARGTHDLLFIDKSILRNDRTGKKRI